jgi:hypothetical protein
MFRTDRGDDEGGTEWGYLRVAGTKDGYNDDNVDILLNSGHRLIKSFKNAQNLLASFLTYFYFKKPSGHPCKSL